MKKVLFFYLLLLISQALLAQKKIDFSLNTTEHSFSNQNINYPLFEPFSNKNYFVIGFNGFYPRSYFLLYQLNNSLCKINDVYFLMDTLNHHTLKTDIIIQKRVITQAEKKQMHKLLASINWNRYHRNFENNFFCKNKNLTEMEYPLKLTSIVQTSDGFSFSIFLHSPSKIRILSFYEWPEFLKICSDKSHHTVQEIFEKSKKYMTLKN